jgi:hypothetical protein
VDDFDLLIAAFSGSASATLLGACVAFTGYVWRVGHNRRKFNAMKAFVRLHAERSIASLALEPHKVPDHRIQTRLELCIFGDVVSPKAFLDIAAEGGRFSAEALSLSYLVRNSDVVATRLLERYTSGDIDANTVLTEAKTNMKHLAARLD